MSTPYLQKGLVAKKTTKFQDISELRSALHSQIPEVLTDALTSIRNQLTVQPQDTTLAPQDDRLTFLKQWLESSPGAQDLFGIWDKANSRQPSFLVLVVSLASSIMTLLSFHYNDYALGQPVMKTLLNHSNMRRLHSYIGGSYNELILVSLRLFNVMSKFAAGQYRKSVLENFPWELKSLPKLLNMRRRSQDTQDRTDPLTRPDIRTLYVLLLISFVDADNATQTKTTFIEQHRDAFLAIFKGISQDHYSLARRILEVCWTGIWSDAKLKRTLKIGLFNEATIGHLIKLYDRHLSEDNDDDHIPANLVHHFLLATCTRPGIGICFKDRGWYQRDSDHAIEDETVDSKRRIYNKILGNILKTLKVNEDSRQQELATKIMMACPELVAGYWPAAALTLEPRLSSKWITNIGFFGCIISLPVPSTSFYLPNSRLYQPTPPSLSAMIENILPSVQTKIHFSKGLLSSSGLVQHCTALALTKCLVKFQAVDAELRKVAFALEEDEEDGQWSKRRRELAREVRRRVPDFQVVVAFSHQKQSDVPGGSTLQSNPTKIALLAESAQRLLWLYHRSLPSMVAEARFEFGKLLQTFTTEGGSSDQAADTASRLYRVQQLHILKLLNESDQFVWTTKIGSLTHSPFCILLRALVSSAIPAIRTALSSLLRHVLSQSILFQEDPHESDLWLKALPTMRPSNDEEVIDGGPLLDEVDAVINFLDDCVQRCLKTPYRYLEDVRSLAQTLNTAYEQNYSFEIYPSSLLMTIVEQLDAKVANKLLIPSQVLGITSFIRKLLFYLSSKQLDLQFLRAVAVRIDAILCPERLFEGFPIFSAAIRREVCMLHASLAFQRPSSNGSTIKSSTEVQAYLDRAEQIPIPVSKQLRVSAALRLVDWMRTVPHPLGTRDLKRLINLVIKVHLPTVHVIQEYWAFESTDLWEALGVLSRFSELRPYLNFEWLFLHMNNQQIMDKSLQTILSDIVFTQTPTLVELTQVTHLVMHSIAASRPRDEIIRAQLSLIASVFQQSKTVLPVNSFDSLKELIFVRSRVMQDIMMTSSSSEVLEGVHILSEAILSPASQNDRKLVSNISYHWVTAVKVGLDDKDEYSVSSACMWIRYLDLSSLLGLLDVLEERAQTMPTLPTLELIKTVLEAFQSRTLFESESESILKERLPQLLSLRSILPDFLLLEDLIAVAIEASLPIGVDGSPLFTAASTSEVDFRTIINRSNARWSHRTHSLGAELDIRQFLIQDTFSDSTVRIISALAYRQCFSIEDIVEWLGTESCSRRQISHLLPIFHAILDSSLSQTTLLIKSNMWLPYISPIVSALADQNSSVVLRTLSRSCIVNILSNAGKDLLAVVGVLTEEVDALTEKTVSVELISLGVALTSRLGKDANSVTSILVDRGMQCMIDQYQLAGDHETVAHKKLADELASLIKLSSVSKPHLVETLLTVIIQGRFNNISALKLAVICLSRTQLKPLVVNRHLQSIIQHPHFHKLCTNNSPEVLLIRDAIIELLHTLFHLHPTNTCQITHVEPLVRIYRGTLSVSDLRILSILQLFETQRKLSVTSLLSRWSFISSSSSQSALEALQSLDPILVLRTCLNLPRWRCVEDQSALSICTQDAQLYDPVFVMLLFGQMLADQPPSSSFAWLELFRTNIISLFIRVLSSKDGRMRELALCQVTALWKQMEQAVIQEKPHILYILNMLKDTIRTHSDEPPHRLPSYTTLILMHALRGIFYPSNFIYPLTARFLLQRPELDTTDVPMLYGMLYSSSDDWKKERGWIIRFLSDGMMSTEDWRVLKRRHTWELLASLYQSSESDVVLRQSILEVLANLTCNAQATKFLVLKSALLSWIEVQLLHSTTGSVAWIRILENILIVVDSNKIEASTNGEWRSAIGRCLEYLLDERSCPSAVENLTHASPVILRLSLLPESPLKNLSTLLDHALNCLDKFENEVKFRSTVPQTLPTGFLTSLHGSSGLHQPYSVQDPLLFWGLMVEMLWRSTMTVERKCPAWDLLMPKLLVWRTIVGGEGSQVGEWARTQVLRVV